MQANNFRSILTNFFKNRNMYIFFKNCVSNLDKAENCDDLWTAFQNAAEIATNLYKGNKIAKLFV